MARGADITDPRAYLQERVALYAKTCTLFFGWLVLMNELMLWAFAEESMSDVTIRIAFGGAVVCCALAWAFTARGARATLLLRAAEVGITLAVTSCFYVLALNPPMEDFIHLLAPGMLALLGSMLVIRAAVVPSGPVLTFALGEVCAIAIAHGTSITWDAPLPFDDQPAAQFIFTHHLLLGSMIVMASTAIGIIVHGLRAKVRDAMRLGQYTLKEKIGEGGMGAVYRASHALLRRPTAVKLVPPEKAGAQALARFEKEVQHASQLTHPNTVAIYDYGHTADGVFYYAMEYLDGITLDQLVEIDGPQPSERVIHVISQAAGALAEAHERGLVHRDIKPANIVVSHRGDSGDMVKVLDFGLVKDLDESKDQALSTTNAIAGTPLYLAPESLTAPDSVDGRTDIYSLGAVAYFLLAARNVFEGRTVAEVCGHHLHTEPAPPSSVVEGVDPALEAIVLKCLAKDPGDRPSDARALRDALLACEVSGRWTRERAETWWEELERTGDAESRTAHGATPALAMTVAAADRERPR